MADASPLIALQQIDALPLLQTLFGSVLVPPAVSREIAPSVPATPFIIERTLGQPLVPAVVLAGLDPGGETEAISLAVEISATNLIVDDRRGRRVASGLGIPIVGTLGLLQAAKRRGLVPAVRPLIDAMLSHGFHVGPEWIQETLEAVGEVEEA